MSAPLLQNFVARPPSEVEWEDLLVRLEITPRALRLAVEDVGDSPQLRALLSVAAAREHGWGERLEDMREGRSFNENAGFGPAPEDGTGAAEWVAVFTRQRERTFARVQRRGLEVWDWRSGPQPGNEPGTAYQLLQVMAHTDGELLAAIRALGKGNR